MSTDQQAPATRRVAVRGLRLISQLADTARGRLEPIPSAKSFGPDRDAVETPPVAPQDHAEGPTPEEAATQRSGSRYAALWNPPTVGDALAQIYNTEEEATFEEGGRQDYERLAPWLSPTSVALDLGCGIGRVARYVAPACAKLWAVDVSPRMLELASSRLAEYGNVQYALCQDVRIADVPSASVDLAYSLLVLQHVEREDAFLLIQELRRVLRPGGTLMVTYPNLLSDTYLECFLEYARTGASSQSGRARLYTPQEVECLMGAAGFEPVLDVGTEIRVTATLRP